MGSAAEHIGRCHHDERLAPSLDEAGIEVGQKRSLATTPFLHLVPAGKTLGLDPAHALHCAQVLLNRCNKEQPRSGALRIGDKGAECFSGRRHFREIGRRREAGLARQHAHALRQLLPFPSPQILALYFLLTGRLLDRAQPAIGMARDPCVRDPSRPAAVVRQRGALSPLALQGKALEHRIDDQFLDLEHDLMLFRVYGDDLADHFVCVLDPERIEGAGWKDLERLAVKERRTRKFRLFVEIIAQSLQTGLQILLGILRTHLQDYAQATQTLR